MTSIYPMSKMTHTVGIADMQVTTDPNYLLITHALGSCLGITIYDPVVRVGGMLHVMLPHSKIDVVKAGLKPHMYVDTGVPMMFREAYQLGARKERMAVKVAGGAQLMDESGRFRIGERNIAMLRKILWKNGISIEAEDVGGGLSRTLTLDIATGEVTIRSLRNVWAL